MRISKDSRNLNGIKTCYELNGEVSLLKDLFDHVILVNPMDLAALNIEKTGLLPLTTNCHGVCPLCHDKCGCICKDVISTWEIRSRFTFDTKSAWLVMCKPVKMQYRDYVIVMIKKLDTKFSFGSYEASEVVKQITNLSSNLVLDQLTCIFNRKYLNDNIEFSIKDCLNSNKALSIACIDIDNFKKFNDTYGHDFGDKVLKLVADSMSKALDGFDEAYPVRIGGDEFVAVGVGLNKRKFKTLMMKLVQIVSSSKLKYEHTGVGVCISVGVSELLEDKVSNYKQLYELADRQLYEAKNSGKNCVR